MAGDELRQKHFPACTVFLVFGAIVCNLLVMLGNDATAAAMEELGASTKGWSGVGLGVARSLKTDLDEKMSNISEVLLKGLEHVSFVQGSLDVVLSLVGKETDAAIRDSPELSLLEIHGPERGLALLQERRGTEGPKSKLSLNSLTPVIVASVHQVMASVMTQVQEALHKLLETIRPALIQVGEWILQFGDKIQAGIEDFSTTMDVAQKIFDQIMSRLHGPGSNHEEMLNTTWELFDVTEKGDVTAEDLKNVAEMFSMTALSGEMPEKLIKKYDSDGTGFVDKAELGLLVNDPAIPGSMGVMLRIYARKLAEIAGQVASARQRDEVAVGVVNYIKLICAKNITKVRWVADRLGNSSLPLEFTADVMAELCLTDKDPDAPRFTTADTGPLLIGEMFALHPQTTLNALDLMANTSWWASEGLDVQDQPECLGRVTSWVTKAKGFKASMASVANSSAASMLQFGGASHAVEMDDALVLAMPKVAKRLAREGVSLHLLDVQQAREQHRSNLFASKTSQALLAHLLGGIAASDAGSGAAAEQAVRSGVLARPETLEFAKWLSINATATVKRYHEMCFTYSAASSNAVDSFAAQMSGMVKKVQGFLDMMQKYATPAGIKRLEDQIESFADTALKDVMQIVEKRLVALVNQSGPALENAIHVAAHNAGERLGMMIGSALAQPLGQQLAGPMKQVVGDLLANNKTGEMLGEKLGLSIGDSLGNLTSAALGDTAGDLFENLVDKALQKGGEALSGAVAKLPQSSAQVDIELAKLSSRSAQVDIEVERLFSPALLQARPPVLLQVRGGSGEEGVPEVLSGAWEGIVNTLRSLSNLLPRAVTTLKQARLEATDLSSNLNGIFETFTDRGPALFNKLAAAWRSIWLIYFACLMPLCGFMLYYGFWASGYFGGPTPLSEAEEAELEAEAPRNFRERCTLCYSSSMMCWRKTHDTTCCFWSAILFLQIIVLITFVISILLCIVAGVKAFVLSGCSQVYILSDEEVCTDSLTNLKTFLSTFQVGEALTETTIARACDSHSLMTCKLISQKMATSTLLTTLFSFLAAIFSLQMLFDSAVLHEQARFRRLVKTMKLEE